ncbi:MAG: hypothetical protein AAFR21_16390 [Pseudomonadota bacterium]
MAQGNKITFDDVLEDLFGLSVRAIKTVTTLFNRPADYYAAAHDKYWEGRFTPSMRMWLSLFALLSFLQFIWLNADSPLVAFTAAQITESGQALPPDMSADELSQGVYAAAYTAFPVLALIALTLGGMVFPFWGKGHSPATRIRSTFITVIPSSIASLILVILTTRLAPDQISTDYSLLGAGIAFIFDFSTSSRGAFSASKWVIRILRALALAIWLGTLTILVSILSSYAGLAIVSLQTGVWLF